MNIDWTTAPPHMHFHACDSDGTGWYYEAEPIQLLESWRPRKHTDAIESGYTLPADQDWRQSLVERPEEESK